MNKMIYQKKEIKENIIYYIFCKRTKKIYIGSTKRHLQKRITDHNYDLKAFTGNASNKLQRSYRTSFEVLINEDYIYGILEHCPNKDIKELRIRESQWIEALRENKRVTVVNKMCAVRKTDYNLKAIPHYWYALPLAVEPFLHKPSEPSALSAPS